MKIDHIEVKKFRNIAFASVDFEKGSNVLLGNNAQGKTNLAEAIFFLALGKSFRVSRFREMISHEEKKAKITAQISGEGLPFELKIELDREFGKAIYKNGVKLSKLSLAGSCHFVNTCDKGFCGGFHSQLLLRKFDNT